MENWNSLWTRADISRSIATRVERNARSTLDARCAGDFWIGSIPRSCPSMRDQKGFYREGARDGGLFGGRCNCGDEESYPYGPRR